MKILNCPFCASPDINIYHEQYEEEGRTVHYAYCECTMYLAQGPMMIRRLGTEERCKRMAKELWNGRFLHPEKKCLYCERRYCDKD